MCSRTKASFAKVLRDERFISTTMMRGNVILMALNVVCNSMFNAHIITFVACLEVKI